MEVLMVNEGEMVEISRQLRVTACVESRNKLDKDKKSNRWSDTR